MLTSDQGKYEDILPLEMIREHTKTDDIPHVTDRLLIQYRAAAFEAAEHYTSWRFGDNGFVSQDVPHVRKYGYFSDTSITVHLKYPASDGLVSVSSDRGTEIINVVPGATEVEIPITDRTGNPSSCCEICSDDGGATLHYKTGSACAGSVPASVIQGVLKLIAWHVMNAGDEILTTRNLESKQSGTLQGSNHAVVVSGALDEWKRLRRVI